MSVRDKFWEFHEDNPQVYEELRALAHQLLNSGREQYGIAGLFEVLRWHRALKTSGEEFKLCNSYRAYYARLLMHRERDLTDFFVLRASEADNDPVFKRRKVLYIRPYFRGRLHLYMAVCSTNTTLLTDNQVLSWWNPDSWGADIKDFYRDHEDGPFKLQWGTPLYTEESDVQ